MRTYQVTRKFQVTIPKRLAERKGIGPGDSVVFEEKGEGLMVRKVGEAVSNAEEISSVVREFAHDVVRVRPHILAAERALVEDLSRHISSKRSKTR